MLSNTAERLQEVGAAFRKLLLSDALTLLGLMVGQVALPWWIVKQGGALHLAQYGLFTGLAAFVAMPLLAPLGDRYPKNHLITAGLLAMALAAMAMTVLASLGQYHFMPLLLAGCLQVIALSVITPAVSSISSELVPAERLTDALSLQKTAQSLGRLLGPALAGLALAAASIPITLGLHCVLLVAAAFYARHIPTHQRVHAQGYSLAHWRGDLLGGLRASWRVPLERYWTFSNFASWLFLGPAIGMLVPIKVHALGLSGSWLGACEAALSAGMLIGTLGAAGWFMTRFSRFQLRVGAGVAQGLTLALAGLTQAPWLLLPALFGCGLANTVLVLVGMTHRMLARPLAFRSRMSAVAIMSGQLAGSLGPAIAGVMLGHYGVSAVYVSFGLLGAAFATSLALVPGFKTFMNLDHTQVRDWYGKQHPAAFLEPTKAAPAAEHTI